ncbi:hypothetical protein [Halalkalicoccus subterraneus]|uniref:hypothetical protein n=1 Tax=Halalkalicoccus subterraneus TaxID=2675002 RepID=UPI0013CEAB3A|nr:hypothetical protein [Halalkalicoccus subterraneus]
MADYAIGRECPLSTSGLGSCVAVAIDEPGGIGGLLHATLPRVHGACLPSGEIRR